MMGLKEAIEYLINKGEENAIPYIEEIGGHTYSTKELLCYDEPIYKAKPLVAHTLTALIAYLFGRKEELKESMIIHVLNPQEVELISGLDEERCRETLFKVCTEPHGFLFDRYYNQENFIVNMQTAFKMTDDLKLILQVAGNVEEKTVANYGDDGTSQKATVSHGIAGKKDVIVPNPVVLKPYRTFMEIDQPESKFVFRISSGEDRPRFKLVEADGGLWKHEAIERICEYIHNMVPEDLKGRITIIG